VPPALDPRLVSQHSSIFRFENAVPSPSSSIQPFCSQNYRRWCISNLLPYVQTPPWSENVTHTCPKEGPYDQVSDIYTEGVNKSSTDFTKVVDYLKTKDLGWNMAICSYKME